MALASLGIESSSERVGFTAIRRIGDGHFRRVPVLENEGEFIDDSWAIAEHLDRLSGRGLFPSDESRAFARFTEYWVASLSSSIGRIAVPYIAEIVCDEALAALRDRHEPARRRLAEDLFLSGDEPA